MECLGKYQGLIQIMKVKRHFTATCFDSCTKCHLQAHNVPNKSYVMFRNGFIIYLSSIFETSAYDIIQIYVKPNT